MLTAAALVLVGCGGQHRRTEPRLSRADAAQLMALAQKVVRDAAADGCVAQREIAALSSKAQALVAAGRVPLRLRAPLLAGVQAVAADAPACAPPALPPTPASAPAPTPAPPAKHYHGKHKGKSHGHGHGHDESD